MAQAPVRKAVIPAAGLGTRFLPATKAQPKEMLPVVDKPAIQYAVEEAARAGIDDVLIVTARGKSAVEDHFDRNLELEHFLEARGKKAELAQVRAIAELATLHSVRQGEPHGLGHAVGVARQHVGDEPFAVLLPDDVFSDTSTLLADMIAAYERLGSSVIGLKRCAGAEISLYGSVRPEPVENQADVIRVLDIVEKPAVAEAPSDLGVMGRYVFTPDIFDAIDRTPRGKGNEIQLTDAIGILAKEGAVHGVVFETGRYDAGDKLDYLRATVELALQRPDIGPAFREFLVDYVKRLEQ